MLWSQPEIALYNPEDHSDKPGYPDLIVEGGEVLITETQKTAARLHQVDPQLLAGLWSQRTVPLGFILVSLACILSTVCNGLTAID